MSNVQKIFVPPTGNTHQASRHKELDDKKEEPSCEEQNDEEGQGLEKMKGGQAG